jgi:tetratricopeptide (TPR) repeat protein
MFKIFRKKTSNNEEKPSLLEGIKAKSENLFQIVKNAILSQISELSSMREKSKNLLETNIKLGLWHIEQENISDAIFRFRFIRFFWPKYLDANYYLAYCYVLKEKHLEAKEILEKLLEKDPQNQKAIELLNKINLNQQ